jgi:hypothetical protein
MYIVHQGTPMLMCFEKIKVVDGNAEYTTHALKGLGGGCRGGSILVNSFHSQHFSTVTLRVAPLLTVETETNGVSKSTNEGGPFLGWFVMLFMPVQEIFVLSWLL